MNRYRVVQTIYGWQVRNVVTGVPMAPSESEEAAQARAALRPAEVRR